jgi:hypothetical protein
MATPPRWSPDPDVVAQRLGDEVVLVHLRTNQIYELSATGARFWELLCEGLTRDEIEPTMLSEFEVPRQVLAEEITSLSRQLVEAGVVTEVSLGGES